jgi:hypothetical protein
MNLSNFETAIFIDQVEKPNDPSTSFMYKKIHIFKSEDIKDHNEVNLNGYKPNKKDKLFFYPGCDVPRYKVRTWGKDKEISITNKESSATHIIAGIKTVKNCLNIGIYAMSEDAEVYCKWLDQNYPMSVELINMKSAIRGAGHDRIFINRYLLGGYSANGLGEIDRYGMRNGHTAATFGFKSLTGELPGSNFKNWTSINYADEAELLKLNTMFDETSNVYSEQSLIEYVNEGSAIIDKAMYEQIRAMFKSNSKEDHLVGLSIMSNCNVKPSLHFLLLLLQEFSHIIVSLKEHKHVNFKSLLKYLNLPRWDMLSVDDLMQCLMDKEELTMKIVKEVAEGVKHSMQNSFNTKHFKISKITVSEDVKTHMHKRIQSQKQLN